MEHIKNSPFQYFIDHLEKFFQPEHDESKLPLVEVGSGRGAHASDLIQAKLIRGEYIAVDPAPQSFDSRPIVIEPHYNYVTDLLKERDLVGKCNLLLIRPDPNSSTYDIEAIAALRPRRIFLLHEATGSAGGDVLHWYLRALKQPNRFQYFSVSPGSRERQDLETTVSQLQLPKYIGFTYVHSVHGAFEFASHAFTMLAGTVSNELVSMSYSSCTRELNLLFTAANFTRKKIGMFRNWLYYTSITRMDEPSLMTFEQYTRERSKDGLTDDYGY